METHVQSVVSYADMFINDQEAVFGETKKMPWNKKHLFCFGSSAMTSRHGESQNLVLLSRDASLN